MPTQPMIPHPPKRREALMACHPDGPILVRGGRKGGLNPNFVYLTGVAEPRGALLLAHEGLRIETGSRHPGRNYVHGRMARQLLFLPQSDPLATRWGEDGEATADGTDAGSCGVDAVLPLSELEPLLGQALGRARWLHYVRGSAPTLLGPDDADTVFVERVRRRFFGLGLRDVTATVQRLRRRKDPSEIAAMRRAVGLTGAALDAAMSRIAPGVHEYEVEAVIAGCYRGSQATHAFEPIVATGGNAALPHYRRNSARLEAGQLVLIDTGASLNGYRGDLTRTYPVSGRFSARQRRIYESVLAARHAAVDRCRPGVLLGDLHATAFDVIDAAGFGEFFIHGTSHHLGLETHDVGDVHVPLEAGCVITVEPGIYLPEEAIGVRIEDDVLVTDDGPDVLSLDVVREIDEIEERMA